MELVKILKEEEFKLIEKALYLYLSAGTKEQRKDASVLAKEAYRILTNKEYKNP